MSDDPDYLYALKLQERFNAGDNDDDSDIEEVKFSVPKLKKQAPQKRSNPHSNLDPDYLNRIQNLVHPQWETLDPTPDIFALFGAFDTKFFQSKLKCVTIEWSKRMYSCAGICYSKRNRYGMDVTIRLSEPLLKLRPRKDLVETMLHEMIHAYCFVLNIREGNGGHGPNFKKIMYAINKVAGTNITVYHTFNDEVELYKQHWWRCNGICQERSPFFGYVKRCSNRAPSHNDQWWAQHQESCGGTFMKIKGPDNSKKKKEKNKPTAGSDLRKYFHPTSTNSQTKASNNNSNSNDNIHGFGNKTGNCIGSVKSNGSGTRLLNPENRKDTTSKNSTGSSIAAAFPPSSYPGVSSDPFAPITPGKKTTGSGYGNKIVSLGDLSPNKGAAGSTYPNNSMGGAMTGKGYSLNSTSSNQKSNNNTDIPVDRAHLRDIRLKRFTADTPTDSCKRAHENKDTPPDDIKRPRLLNKDPSSDSNVKNDWVIIDDDVMILQKKVEVIELSSDDSDNEDLVPLLKRTNFTADERHNVIKQEILDESNGLEEDDIILIDDEYDDNEDNATSMSVAIEIADTSIIDEFFGEDTLLKEFKEENDLVPRGSNYVPKPDDDIITCAICQSKMKRSLLSEHLDGCAGISTKVVIPKHALKKLAAVSKELKPTRKIRHLRHTSKDLLRRAGYSDQDLENISFSSTVDEDSFNTISINSSPESRSTSINDLNSPEDTTSRRYRQRNLFKTTRQCPRCGQEIEDDQLIAHGADCR